MFDVQYLALAQCFVPGRYRHYKGNCYIALGVCFHPEMLEEMVVYQPDYTSYVQFLVDPWGLFFRYCFY